MIHTVSVGAAWDTTKQAALGKGEKDVALPLLSIIQTRARIARKLAAMLKSLTLDIGPVKGPIMISHAVIQSPSPHSELSLHSSCRSFTISIITILIRAHGVYINGTLSDIGLRHEIAHKCISCQALSCGLMILSVS